MVSLKVTKVGESVGIILPKDVLERVKLGEGDTVFLTKSADGLRITSYDPSFEEQTTHARSSCAITAMLCVSWRSDLAYRVSCALSSVP